MRRLTLFLAAASACLLAPAGALAAGDAVKVRTGEQATALATGQVAVRARAAGAAEVELTAKAPGAPRRPGANGSASSAPDRARFPSR